MRTNKTAEPAAPGSSQVSRKVYYLHVLPRITATALKRCYRHESNKNILIENTGGI